jgi:hypothetical protein
MICFTNALHSAGFQPSGIWLYNLVALNPRNDSGDIIGPTFFKAAFQELIDLLREAAISRQNSCDLLIGH